MDLLPYILGWLAPTELISTYQTATNWKTLYDGGTLTFAAIEGSQYEL